LILSEDIGLGNGRRGEWDVLHYAVCVIELDEDLERFHSQTIYHPK